MDQLRRGDFGYGQICGNFAISGLPDDEVCIGDRYRIGEALFEVTQLRVTCYGVGIQMAERRLDEVLDRIDRRQGGGRMGLSQAVEDLSQERSGR